MSEWSPQDWAIFFGVASPFLAAILGGLLKIILALKENTRVTVEAKQAVESNTADRAVKAAESNMKLDAVAVATGAATIAPAAIEAGVVTFPPTAPSASGIAPPK